MQHRSLQAKLEEREQSLNARDAALSARREDLARLVEATE
jgi:hypothetical protein